MLDMWKYLASLLWITPEQQGNGWAMWLRKLLLDKDIDWRELLQLQAALYHLQCRGQREINTVYWLY